MTSCGIWRVRWISRWIASGVEPFRIRRACPLGDGSTTVTTWCVESCSRSLAHEVHALVEEEPFFLAHDG